MQDAADAAGELYSFCDDERFWNIMTEIHEGLKPHVDEYNPSWFSPEVATFIDYFQSGKDLVLEYGLE